MQQTIYARIARKKNISRINKRPKTIFDYMRNFCRNLVKFFFTQVGVCGLLVGYNVAGAFAFQALEGTHGDTTIEETAAIAQDVAVKDLWNLTLNLNVLDKALWKESVHKSILKYEDVLKPLILYKGYRGLSSIETWTIPASMMYSLSVYTTIGYGNLAPRTPGGKIATIFYALIGMPLMLLYMSNVGEILAGTFKFLYFSACRCDIGSLGYYRTANGGIKAIKSRSQGDRGYSKNLKSKSLSSTGGNRYNRRESEALEEENFPRQAIPITWCLVIIATYVLFGGMLFAFWEGWTALDACYFCYTSLSTIGLGDIVPGGVTGYSLKGSAVETQQILATVYLLVGMALVAMCFNLMQEEALENLKAFWRGIGFMRPKSTKEAKSDISLEKIRTKYQWKLRRPFSGRETPSIVVIKSDPEERRPPLRKDEEEEVQRLK